MNWLEEVAYDYNLFAVMVTFLIAFSNLCNAYAVIPFCFLLILLLVQFTYYARELEKEKNPKKFNPLRFWNPSSRQNEDDLKDEVS